MKPVKLEGVHQVIAVFRELKSFRIIRRQIHRRQHRVIQIFRFQNQESVVFCLTIAHAMPRYLTNRNSGPTLLTKMCAKQPAPLGNQRSTPLALNL